MAEEKNDMDWLKKMRPWAGHYNHFHVRLSCPKNSELCINQADVNNSSGCGSELDFWMKKDKLFESNSTKIRKCCLIYQNHVEKYLWNNLIMERWPSGLRRTPGTRV